MRANEKKLAAIDRAVAYGESTSNFVPLLAEIGSVTFGHQLGIDEEEFQKLRTIPANWEPEPPPVAVDPSEG